MLIYHQAKLDQAVDNIDFVKRVIKSLHIFRDNIRDNTPERIPERSSKHLEVGNSLVYSKQVHYSYQRRTIVL